LAHALLECGRHEGAAEQMRAALAQFPEFDPIGLYRACIWWTGYRVLDRAGDKAAALDCLRAGRDWIESTAREHVPDEFRDTFLEGNEVNRKLLTAARAQLD
jgi:hypothetical protein